MRIALVVIAMFVSLMSFSMFGTTNSVSAQSSCDDSSLFLEFPTWHKYLEKEPRGSGNECAIVAPQQNGETDIAALVSRVALAIVEILLRVATLIAVGFVIFGGFRFITSQGEPENAKSARQTIQNGIIGLVISLVASGAVAFIGGQFI